MGYVSERLLASGALDVFATPIYMKKNRPAYLLSVLCAEEKVAELEHIIFTETTSIGIRKSKMERSILARRFVEVATPYGNVRMKVCAAPEGERYFVEYESAAELARAQNVALRLVYAVAEAASQNL